MRRFLSEVAEVVAIVAGFAAFAATVEAISGVERAPATESSRRAPQETYAAFRMVDPEREPVLWLVDGFNVLNLAILGDSERAAFWGPAARARLLRLVAELPEPARVVVVFDGSRPAPLAAKEAEPGVVFAPSADEWILREIRAVEDPNQIALVTADRKLADRARHRGARIVEPATFVARCRNHRPHPPAS